MITPLSRHHQHGPTFPVEKLHDGWNLGLGREAFRDIEDARVEIATYFGILPHLVMMYPLNDTPNHYVFTVRHADLGGPKLDRLYYFCFKVEAGDPPPFVPLFTPLITTVPFSKGKKSWARRLMEFTLRRPATQQ